MPKNITYEQIIGEIEATKNIRIADLNIIIQRLISEEDFTENYSESNIARLHEIATCFGNKVNQCEGNLNELHNLAVAYAKNNMFREACQILERGLEMAAYSVDLISDYIKYGMFCWHYEKCAEYYGRLKSIDKTQWTWRAYSFSIDYLLDLRTQTNDTQKLNEIKTEALELAEQFIKQIGVEQAYFDKATIYCAFNEHDNEKQTLMQGVERLNRATKCSLKLADLAFEEGDYSLTVQYIKKCMNNFTVQPEVDRGYAYLLMALGKASLLFGTGDNENSEKEYSTLTPQIKEIYKYFHTALQNELDGVYKTAAETTIKTIEAQTGVNYTYNDSNDPYDF